MNKLVWTVTLTAVLSVGAQLSARADEPTAPRPLSRLANRYPQHFVSAPPGSSFHPQTVPGPYPPFAANASVPSFTWGYFGARSHPTVSRHTSVTGDTSDRFLPGR